MRKIDFIRILFLLVLSFASNYAFADSKQKHEVRGAEQIDGIEDSAVNLMQLKDKDVRIEKLARVGKKLMTFYTVQGDSSYIYVLTKSIATRHNHWESDTIKLNTNDSTALFTDNLSIFVVFNNLGQEQVKIFCGKDKTYEKTIRRIEDFDKPFLRVSDFCLGKIMGAYFDKKTWSANIYFCSNSEVLAGKQSEKGKFLYKLVYNRDLRLWSDPIFVAKHNVLNFENYSFARNIKSKDIDNFSIMSFNENSTPYLSEFNFNNSEWEYPTKMNENINGHGHKIFIGNNIAYVMFFRTIEDDILDDMYIWFGRLRDLEKGCKNGDFQRVTNNAIHKDLSRQEKLVINSSMNADIVIKNNKILSVISAKWLPNLPTYALKVEILEKRIVPYIR
ncbi:MAG: hypothetical protein R3Y26_07870 [Rikenellaceae bacterium]